MLRIAATALLCAAFILCATLFHFITGSKPRPAALASATEPHTVEVIYGRVRAVAARERFDPFGEIVPLPMFKLEQIRRPAFDPSLYRGGRVGEAMKHDDLCDVLEEVADEFDLPASLFTRLIWQESRFRNETVSRAGAQGMAQFMPRTAEIRGLSDPFDPFQALPASAEFLRDLVGQFGNFGLAAAAYNGGPTRVRNWLAGRGNLPKETRDYVLHITGRTVEHWRRVASASAHPEAFRVKECDVQPIRSTEVPVRN